MQERPKPGPGRPSECTADAGLAAGLLASAHDLIEVLTAGARLESMSPGGRALMAVTDFAPLAGADWLEWWLRETRELAAHAVAEARAGRSGRFVGLRARMDGERRWWDVVVSPVCDERGEVARLLAISRDVTAIKAGHRVLEAEREVLAALSHLSPAEGAYASVCRLAVSMTGGAVRARILLNGEAVPAESDSMLRAELTALDPVKHFGALVFDVVEPLPPACLQPAMEKCACLAAAVFNREDAIMRLRAKRERLAAIDRAAPVGIYQLTAEGKCAFTNDRYAELVGPPDGSPACWLERIHADDRGWVEAAWQQGMKSKSTFSAEFRLARALHPGMETWVYAQEGPAEDGGRIGTLTDISAPRHSAMQHAEATSLFGTLANNMMQLCWMADPSGWIFWYNDRWFDYTGTTIEQMRGWGWQAVHHPEHVERVTQKISRHWQSGEVWEDTFPLRAKTGEYRWFLSRAIPIRDPQGKVLRWLGTNTDITEQRELEQTLSNQNAALKRSNDNLSRFAFFASHDLQEPLRSITSFAQLAQRQAGDSDSKLADYLRRVVDSSRRMHQLIRDLLLYSQSSADGSDVHNPVAFGDIVDSVVRLLTPHISEADAEIVYGELPVVLCNESQIKQVVQNFLSNALKYARPGVAPRIEITAAREGAEWRLSFADNGQGFDSAYSSRIFEFLKRLHGKDVPGTGIGLAICKNLIERNGGTIGAEGRLGEGSTFWFTLPAAPLN